MEFKINKDHFSLSLYFTPTSTNNNILMRLRVRYNSNREKKNIISCHVASAHLLPGEQKLSSNQIDDNNDNKGNNDDDDGNDGCCVSSQFGFSLANGNSKGWTSIKTINYLTN